ncbi:hypothetical protein Psi01_46970 [Planobispora siamensis]|uniref:Uncharacterized protein n=1 Tax=Planobispora siamensis TaxID=936338 RepID=A0A8J3WN38_9ACTN|nr:hypothetical protein Psi01_46970 [Planobispora siamensis]
MSGNALQRLGDDPAEQGATYGVRATKTPVPVHDEAGRGRTITENLSTGQPKMLSHPLWMTLEAPLSLVVPGLRTMIFFIVSPENELWVRRTSIVLFHRIAMPDNGIVLNLRLFGQGGHDPK